MSSSIGIRYERIGDRVRPVRFTKQWVTYKGLARGGGDLVRFITVRATEVDFPLADQSEAPAEPWSSCPQVPITREYLIALGLLKPPGHGEKYLPIEGPIA